MKFRSRQQIAADYPFVPEKAKELTEVFGGYSGVKVFDGELVYSWEKKETHVVPTNTILNRHYEQKDLTRKPHKWNDGINRRGQREL